jgi:hypothetical protein
MSVKVMRIATGEEEEEEEEETTSPSEPGRKGGIKGGPARARALSPERRKEIAKQAAKTRWKA